MPAVKRKSRRPTETPIHHLLRRHFAPAKLVDLTVSERSFPYRVRADLQRAIDDLFEKDWQVVRFLGLRKPYAHETVDFPAVIADDHYPAVAVPPQYEDIDTGDERPVHCLKNGLWLLRHGKTPLAVLLSPTSKHGEVTGVTFQVAVPAGSTAAASLVDRFFRRLEQAVADARSYRGKILSLEADLSYSGRSTGIRVHRLAPVRRDQVILPARTLDLLDRNVIGFVRNRARLSAFRQATKKGLLFYGPPGTGKTHTIHYLAGSLPGHTTLIIAAEQIVFLSEYMTLARLLQPSLVVIEDVDLIARDWATMHSPCEEVLLNKLLNEMDGLKEQADILFVLTTNRPEALEAALASRPGRIDQAIEFPPPDDDGRAKLIRLYAAGVSLSDDVVRAVVQRTAGVSAAFIKELMRRSVQFHLGRGADSGVIELRDVDAALDEMLFAGGSLNRTLLGGGTTNGSASP